MNAKIFLREGVSKLRPKWTRWWVLQRWWWRTVASSLMTENRRWESMYEGVWDELRIAEDRIEELEEMAHPSKDLCEFAGFDDLETRIKELENELAKR